MSESSHRKRVVVVGSGFAGFECARRLSKTLARKQPDTEVALVSPQDYFLYTPLLPDVAGGLIDPRYVAIPLASSLKQTRLITGRATSVDFSNKTVTIADQSSGDRELSWDRLVLTPGSVTRLFDIPGLAEHGRGLKTVAEALYLREQLLRQLELADQESDADRARARRTVVIVGASYAGTELVSQLHALADDYTKQRGGDPRSVRFLLLDLADKVMPEVGERLGTKALHALRERGIDIRLETTLKEVHADHVILSDDTRVDTFTLAWVTGVTGAPVLKDLGLELDHGRLVVTPNLTVPGNPDVFAAGDAAAVPDLTKPGKVTPPTAQHAVRQGHTLARNVAASLGVGTAKAYRHRDMGLVVDLGPNYAVANPMGIHLSGLPAKLVTRGYHLMAVPRLVNRWAIGASYATNTVADRPLVLLGLVSGDEAAFAESESIPLREGS